MTAPKVAVVAGLGPLFGITWVQSVRAGLLLAAGGEFAFVAFGERRFASALATAASPSFLFWFPARSQ